MPALEETRPALWRPHQGVHVFVKLPIAQDLEVELWSEGSRAENAGSGLLVALSRDQRGQVALRRGATLTPRLQTALPETDQLRLALTKDEGAAATLQLAAQEGDAWRALGTVRIQDDHQLQGRHLRARRADGGPAGPEEVQYALVPPAEVFSLNRSFDGLADWKVFQRGPDGTADIPLSFVYRAAAPARLEVQVRDAAGRPLPGLDFVDHAAPLAAAPLAQVRQAQLPAVPTGGNYALTARLVDAQSGAVLGQDEVRDIAVGDVFLAAGQSNMSGISDALVPTEESTPQVHLFGNDYRWQQATEPMDSPADQVDLVSLDEAAQHSLMLRFGKRLAGAVGVPVAIIPAPAYASGLFRQWQRQPDDVTNRGTLYGSAVHRVRAQGYAHPIRGVLWYQGESDAALPSDRYLELLRALVRDLRVDLGAPGLYFGSCQLATYMPFPEAQFGLEDWLGIQDAQRRYAQEDPAGSGLVGLADMARIDWTHLSLESQKQVGDRLARQVARGAYGAQGPVGPALLAARLADETGALIELRHDQGVLGGSPALFRVRDEDGDIPVREVSASGAHVRLRLSRPARGRTVADYGYSFTWEAPWVRGADGPALLFRDLEIQR